MTRPALTALCLVLAPVAQAQEGDDILVLGEVHDNPAHHLTQAQLVADHAPVALVFEMLTPEQAAGAEGIAREDAEALEVALGWEGSGWPDFAMYHPIFLAAPEAAIIGAAVPFADMSVAASEGAATAFGPEAEGWGLTALSDADLARRGAEMQEAHCNALPESALSGIVEAQRLRDAHFARTAAEAHDTHGGPVAIITGTGHARGDHGVPFHLGRARPDLTVWSLGQFEAPPEAEEAALFDATAHAPPAEREDPCLAFAR